MLLLLLLFAVGFSLELSLSDAIELALKNNRVLKKLEKELKSATFRKDLAVFERFSPELDLRASKDRLEAVARILLLEFGKRAHKIKAEEIRRQIAQITLEEFKNQLKIEVAKLYTDILIYDILAQEKREFMAVAFVRFDREREKLRLGLSDRVKVAQLERTYRMYRAQLFEIQRKYNETLYKLKRYLGIDMKEDVVLKHLNFNVPENESLDESELLKHIKDNYRLRIKEKEIAYYKELEKGEGTLYKPEVVLEGRLGRDFDDKENYAKVNAYIRLPLFDPRIGFRKKTLKEKRLSLIREYEEIKSEIEEKIYTFPYRWDEYLEKYKYAKTNMEWAERNLDLKRSEYELQLAFDLGYAMAYYTQAERQLLESKVRILLFLMEVYHTIGKDPIQALKGTHFFMRERVQVQ
ncbi:MAG: hypothetical protein DSY42_01920 [Aquifex sp.]|nr:MAG: hypothetical protein DSY42_01920 [Aquifex sp.]